MSVEVGGDDNDIIEIDEQGSLVQPTQDLLHESLERGRSGRKSERQHLPFTEPIPRNKRSLVLCFRIQGTCQYPLSKSNKLKNLLPAKASSDLSILGRE